MMRERWVVRVRGGLASRVRGRLAVEEPLELRGGGMSPSTRPDRVILAAEEAAG